MEKSQKEKEIDLLYDDAIFIETTMSFYSFNDFKENANYLRQRYHMLGFRTKKLFKWYVYSRCMSYKQKDYIWDFLNDEQYCQLEN